MPMLNQRPVNDPECPNADWEGECEQCGRTVTRFRGEGDVGCQCGAEYNCFGQRLRDDWRSNQSNYDDDIRDLDGYEMAALAADREWDD